MQLTFPECLSQQMRVTRCPAALLPLRLQCPQGILSGDMGTEEDLQASGSRVDVQTMGP